MHYTSSDLRQKYLDFFKSKNHAIIPSAPLVPENDASVLFNTAGMQPLVPYLLGEKHPMGTRLTDAQKCVRTGDIDDVGDDSHCTFFEMLGNWSLGDYFKKESIAFSWEFLTDLDWLGLDPKMISVTVFEGDENAPRDEESADIWAGLGMPRERIAYLPAEDNWWAVGPTGPCGPDTEIFYWVGTGEPQGNKGTNPDDWMEIWNNVFMQFNRKKVEKTLLLDGVFCLINEDFSLNEEVYTLAKMLGLRTIIVTNAPLEKLMPIVEQTGFEYVTYEHNPEKTDPEYYRKLLVDKNLKASECVYVENREVHVKVAEGLGIPTIHYTKPSDIKKVESFLYSLEPLPAQNVDTGMGLERTLAVINNKKSVYETDLFENTLEHIKRIVGEVNYVERGARIIADHLRTAVHMIADGVKPSNTDRGYVLRRLLRRAIREAHKMGHEDACLAQVARDFIRLYENVYASVKNNEAVIIDEISMEEAKFQKTIKNGFRELSKLQSIDGKEAFGLFETYGLPFEMIRDEIIENGGSLATNFETDFDAAMTAHQDLSRTASAGMFKGGLADHSEITVQLHTACHLMLAGLRKVLGPHIMQAGSNITPERLRFDFTHPEKMTPEQIAAVEEFVNNALKSHITVTMNEEPKESAKARGVLGAFWEKYPDTVKVYTMVGDDGIVYSEELCGGPHIGESSTMGTFKIQKEEASSAGVRRIKAVLQ
ncbi:MAG: HAD-IA family hydrolase [Candidatus Gracilibacteria bacterium]